MCRRGEARGRLRALRACALAACVLVGAAASRARANVSFERGDADRDGAVALTDAIFLLNFLFLGGPAPQCLVLADADDDDELNITDGVFILGHLFLGTQAPPPLTSEEDATCRAECGRLVYESPDPGGNGFACATCHGIVPDAESELLRPGSSLHDAVRRPSYKLGTFTELRDAANTCRVYWMATTPWEEGDQGYLDLRAFLESVAPEGPAPPVEYDVVPPAADVPPGSADDGCALFHRSCVICHGAGAAGTALAPSLVAFPLGAEFIRLKVRQSGPPDSIYEDLIGGFMPFWSAQKLTDAQVEDLVAYLSSRPVAECVPAAGDP